MLIDSDKLDDDQKIRKVIKNGTLNIGYAGLKESLTILLNKNNIDNDDLKIALDIIKFMKEKCDKYTDEYKLNFMLFETIDKNILEYFEAIDKSVYGNINKLKYTPFYSIFDELKDTIDDRFKLESKIHKYSNGGYYEVIHIPKNYSYKKVIDILYKAKEHELGYIKIKVGKLE